MLILQSGLRHKAVGPDTNAYKWIFERSQTYSWSEIFSYFTDYSTIGMARDPGYLAFKRIVYGIFGDDYQVLLIAIAVVFFTAFGRFIYYNTSSLKQATLAYVIYSVMFYSFFSITGHRQTIAVSLLLFGFEFLKKKKYVAFLPFSLISFFLHNSSIVFLLSMVVLNIKKPSKVLLAILIAFPFLMVFNQDYFNTLQSIIGYEAYERYAGAGTLVFSSLLALTLLAAMVFQSYLQKSYPQSIQIIKIF